MTCSCWGSGSCGFSRSNVVFLWPFSSLMSSLVVRRAGQGVRLLEAVVRSDHVTYSLALDHPHSRCHLLWLALSSSGPPRLVVGAALAGTVLPRSSQTCSRCCPGWHCPPQVLPDLWQVLSSPGPPRPATGAELTRCPALSFLQTTNKCLVKEVFVHLPRPGLPVHQPHDLI